MKKIFILLPFCMVITGRSWAILPIDGQTMCLTNGDSGGGYMVGTDGKKYVCYSDDVGAQMLYPTTGAFDYICATYTSTTVHNASSGIYRLNNCNPGSANVSGGHTFLCAYNRHLNSSASGCEDCPTGYVATTGDAHYLYDCSLCAGGYYKSSGYCRRCPENGYSNIGTSAITDCYVSYNYSGQDESGKWTYAGICYYSY